MDEMNPLVGVAMQIIIHTGDARTRANEALDALAEGDFKTAKEKMAEAHQKITLAHQAQTDIIQREASGERIDGGVLFSHAQDTLMTVMSEVNLSDRLVQLFEVFSGQLRRSA